jgi:hypothetical protein
MRTIIKFKASETRPAYETTFYNAAPSFDFEEDHINVSLIDYNGELVSEDFPLLAIESITWDEKDNDNSDT